MRHAFRAHPAESLIETLVAITVIVVATTAALTVMRTAVSGNELVEKKIVAINLALEGLEALKNVRDTNYLLFASDADTCWNKYDVSELADCSNGTAPTIEEGRTYYLVRNFSSDPLLSWIVREVSNSNNGTIDLYKLDIDGDGDWDENAQMYSQNNLTDSDFDSVEANLFRRRFTVVEAADGNAYDATMTVTWRDLRGILHSIDLTRTIRNIY